VRAGSAIPLALTFLALLFTRAEAQGVNIHMHSGEGYAADGVLFEPATGQPPFPAILLIPDERGLTKRVTDTAQDLSAAGYFVTVVDLNRGEPPDVAKHSGEQALHDLNAALGFLAKQSRVRHDCFAALGWQSGGIYALKLAAADPKICTVVVRGAALPNTSLNLTNMHAEVMASFAGADPTVSPGGITAFSKRLAALGHVPDLKTYPQAAVGFDDPEDSAHFRPVDAQDLRARTLTFLKAHLADRR
jgi:carboxymethylenebutenolidase